MKTTKKLLSLLLVVVMLMSSMSVCFGSLMTASAAASTSQLQELANALKKDVFKNNTFPVTNTGFSRGGNETHTASVTLSNYQQYADLLYATQLLYQVIMATDDYKNALTWNSNGSCKNASNCINAGDIRCEILFGPGSIWDASGATANSLYSLMGASDYATYHASEFVEAVLYTGSARSHSSAAYIKNNTPGQVYTYFTINYTGTEADARTSYLASAAVKSIADVAETLPTKAEFYVNEHRVSWSSKYHNRISAGSYPITLTQSGNALNGVKAELTAHDTYLNNYINADGTLKYTVNELYAMGDAALTTLEETFLAEKAEMIEYVGGEATYKKLFRGTATEDFIKAIETAKHIGTYITLGESYSSITVDNSDYGVYNYPNLEDNYDDMVKVYNELTTLRTNIIEAGGESAFQFLQEQGYIAADDAYYTNLTDNIKAYDLKVAYEKAEALYNTYGIDDSYADLSDDEKAIYKSTVQGTLDAIPTYSAQVINSFYENGDYQYLVIFRDKLDVELNETIRWFIAKMAESYVDASTADIMALIDEVKTNLATLEAYYSQLCANSSQTAVDEFMGDIMADARGFADTLYPIIADRFTAEVDVAYEVYNTLADKNTFVTINDYLRFKPVFAAIEADILSYVDNNGQGSYITQATRDKYNAMKPVYEKYVEAAKSYGFSVYKQTEQTYDARNNYENDTVKDDYAAYKPTETALNELVAKLDSFLGSETFADLVGLDGGIAGAIEPLLVDLICTDEFINTVVGMLYPIVTTEFENVWVGLPTSADIPILGAKDVSYNYTLYEVFEKDGMYAYPGLLAGKLTSTYSEAKTALTAAGDDWNSSAIYDGEKLTLNWGMNAVEDDPATEVNEKLEYFYKAFGAAMQGLNPLLFALLCDYAWEPANITDFAECMGFDVYLSLGATGNAGYVNLLGAAFEALGLTTDDGVRTNDEMYVYARAGKTNYVARAIFEPIFALIENLGDAPLSTLMELLPNLIYALEFNMVPALLSMLKTEISYKGAAVINYGLGSFDYEAANGSVSIDIGEMLDITSLLPFDLSKGITGILQFAGIDIPTLDLAFLATAGKLNKDYDSVRTESIYGAASGKAYHIEPDTADIAYYLLTYILELVQDEEALTKLLGMIITTEDANGDKVPNEESIAGIKEIIYGEMLNLDEANIGDVIAAIVELLADPQDYSASLKKYNWYTANVEGDVEGVTPADLVYLSYDNNWTEETAKYVTDNLNAIISSIVTMIDSSATFDLGAIIDDAISGLFTSDTINGLTASILELLESEEAAGTINTLKPILKDFVGIDLDAVIKLLKAEYTVASADDFVDALTTILEPLSPVLNFLLDGDDLKITLNAGNTVDIKGYSGYETALVPLLAALGVTEFAVPEDIETITFVLNAILGRIEALTNPAEGSDTIKEILNLLPGVFYYLASGALSTAVDNLLLSVYAVLDVIRPVVDINLDLTAILADADIKINGQPVEIDINNIGIGTITDILKAAIGLDFTSLEKLVYDVCAVLGTDYTYYGFAGEGKIGAYNANFEAHDMVTVIISYVLDWLKEGNNAADLEALLAKNNVQVPAGIINAVLGVLNGTTVNYTDPNYGYFLENGGMNEALYLIGIKVYDTSVTYPTDWTQDAAAYVEENITYVVDSIIGLINANKEDAPKTLSEITSGLTSGIYTKENVEAIRDLIADLLKDIDTTLTDAAGKLLSVDVNAFANYVVGEVTDGASFAHELAGLLGNISGLLDWLLFGNDYAFFNTNTGADAITISGGLGYAKGLVPVLEALGVNLPNNVTVNDVEAVLAAVFARLDDILTETVITDEDGNVTKIGVIDKIIELLPNVIYFINADGVKSSVNNLFAPIFALLDALNEAGIVNLNLKETITNAIGFDLFNIDFDTIIDLVADKTGLTLNELGDLLDGLVLGNIAKYENSVGDDAYKMYLESDVDKRDFFTVLLTAILLTVYEDGNAEALDTLLNTDGIVLKVTEILTGADFDYSTPDWDYCIPDGTQNRDTIPVIESAISYPDTNNWNEDTAKYVTENLTEIVNTILKAAKVEPANIGELLSGLVADNLYTGANIQAIVDAVAGLLGGIDKGLLEAAGKLLDVDIVGLADYTAPEGIDTAEEFSAELSNVLTTYAGRLLDWLLFGKSYRFFVDETKVNGEFEDGDEIITITGAHGYAEGLALLLEALGCENLPEVYDVANFDSTAAVKAIIDSLFARIEDLLTDSEDKSVTDKILDLVPNLLYFLNANGVAAVVDNLTAGLMALIEKLAPLGVTLDLNELINIPKLLGLVDENATAAETKELYKIDIDTLTIEAILEVLSAKFELDLTVLEDVLVGFALGKVDKYDSVSRNAEAYKMSYDDEFARYDMITVIANAVLLVIEDEDNEATLKKLIGENIYTAILNFYDMVKVEVQDFNWMYTTDADTDKVFSALSSSELYKDHKYGPHYTEEMAQYIADNFGDFVNNIIYLLGLNIGGKDVNNLTELLNGLVGGGLYNSDNAQAIADALAGVADSLEGLGDGAGKYIIEVLKTSLGVDLYAYETMTFEYFENDRAAFEAAILKIAEPIYPLLKWLLADADFTFFIANDSTGLITLEGGEGYAYGIIPLLEVLGCDNVMKSTDYYTAVANDDSVLITSILPVLLDRIDVILANPADEILEMLPNLIYFINSNGVDTVVKNTLNAVYTLLNAIEPIAKVDLYGLIGLDLSTLTFEKIFEMLLDMIADATGYEFTNLDASAVAELTVGKVVSYESANGKTAYKMVYASDKGAADMVTVVMRLLITFIMHENNQEMLLGLLRDNLGMAPEAEKYVRGLLDTIADLSVNTQLGMDSALATLYYLFYGLDLGIEEVVNKKQELNNQWQAALKELGKTEEGNTDSLGDALADFLDTYLDGVITSDGVAPDGALTFFQRIVEIFNKIIAWFKMIFGVEE